MGAGDQQCEDAEAERGHPERTTSGPGKIVRKPRPEHHVWDGATPDVGFPSGPTLTEKSENKVLSPMYGRWTSGKLRPTHARGGRGKHEPLAPSRARGHGSG